MRVEVREKGKLTRYKYDSLTEEERDIKKGDRIQCAYEDQEKDFEFINYLADGTVYCWGNGARIFYGDAVKLSSREIKRRRDEDKRARRAAKRNR